MPTDSRPWLQDVDARMVISKLDKFPDINSKLSADNRQFVGKCYIHISKGVFCQLAHLGCSGIGRDAFGLDKCFIKISGSLRATYCHSTNNAIITDKFLHDFSGQDSLWAVGNIYICLFSNLVRKC